MNNETITTPRGDTWLNTLPITDKNGAPYDLTGALLLMTVKQTTDRSSDDALALFQLVIGDGLTVTNPLTGLVAVEISDERTALLQADTSYAYDVQVRKGNQTFTPIGGELHCTSDVTKT